MIPAATKSAIVRGWRWDLPSKSSGLVIFLGAHVFVTRRNERAALVAKIGEWPYRGLFSLVSIIGIGLIAYGFAHYRAAGLIPCGSPPLWTRHIVIALMWPASIMVAAAYIPGNIKRVLKHPLLVAVKTWAFAHLCANGDLGGMILFGSVLAWAVYDRISLKHRTDPGGPPIPDGGSETTSLPSSSAPLSIWRSVLVFHPIVIGLPAFGTAAFGS